MEEEDTTNYFEGILKWKKLFETLEYIEEKVEHISRRLERMAVDQATFDAELGALVTSVQGLEDAVTAWLAANPAVDFTAEEAQVQAAAADVAAALAEVTPAPPVTP